ncbi:nucleotidyl transferase AbiEii/AbiGii toxin family protein [Mesonia maritima]|uniref:Nucleotidyltransferase n=1 Tax=Mesonia maritima TaxID=1793873 RepID=A0ABU1K2D7_9FLAO|nr:nucleotidyl transferase AbiEii/AbiGii toxin family protein [Mesonia maritima]MDR6299774.1 putative nucleotidyltransferase [Mesonia maritima]
MQKDWKNKINTFIELCHKNNVRMLMVGGGAVNFHGYQRHSADVDFWIETSENNFQKLLKVFRAMNYELDDFPLEVKNKHKNISVKFSPEDLNLELITNFSSFKTFEEAYKNSEKVEIEGHQLLKWRVLSYEDLIESKLRAKRPKDLLDVQQLQEIKKRKD